MYTESTNICSGAGKREPAIIRLNPKGWEGRRGRTPGWMDGWMDDCDSNSLRLTRGGAAVPPLLLSHSAQTFLRILIESVNCKVDWKVDLKGRRRGLTLPCRVTFVRREYVLSPVLWIRFQNFLAKLDPLRYKHIREKFFWTCFLLQQSIHCHFCAWNIVFYNRAFTVTTLHKLPSFLQAAFNVASLHELVFYQQHSLWQLCMN